MVRHNNEVPHQHFHKKWHQTKRGPLKVKTWFQQPAQKKQRRLKRAEKAKAIAPRPLSRLRPAVMCPTQRYSSKMRLGRGFTLEELKVAGIAPAFAKTIGIAVDHRRVNKCQESLDRNVDRLKVYKEKLIIFPRKGNKTKAGDASAETRASLPDLVSSGALIPLSSADEKDIEYMELTDEVTEGSAYATLRTTRNELKLKGIREKMAKEAEEKKK